MNHLPNRNVPEAQKDESYHKRMHDGYLGGGYLNVNALANISQNYKRYQGRFNPEEEFAFLMISDNGVPFPITFSPVMETTGYIEHKVGDLASRPFKPRANAISPKAIDRKADGLLNLEVDHEMLPFAAQLQDMSGLPFVREDTPKTATDLRDAKLNYKEMGEIIHTRILRYFHDKHQWPQYQKELAEDLEIAGICHIGIEMVNGFPQPKLYRADEVLCDVQSRDPFFRDETVKAKIRYTSMAELTYKYNLTKKQRENIRQSSSFRVIGYGGQEHLLRANFTQGEELALETTVYWLDYKPMTGKTFSKNGISHTKMFEKDFTGKYKNQKADQVDDFNIEQIRYCTVLGGQEVVEHGLLENQFTSYDDTWTKTRFPIASFSPSHRNGQIVSPFDKAWPIELMMNECLVQIKKAMKKDRGKATLIDEAQIPRRFKLTDLPYFAEWLGIIPINSGMAGIGSNFNQYQTVDFTISQSVTYYIDLYMFYAERLKHILGTSDAYLGRSHHNSRVGVTENNREQSNIRAQFFYSTFNAYQVRFLEMVVNQYRKAMLKDPEKFRHIIGQDGLDFLNQHKDFAFEDYGISIEGSYNDPDKHAILQQIMMDAVLNQGLNPATAIQIIYMEDPEEARTILALELENMERKAKQNQQEQMMAEQQQLQQQIAAEQEQKQQELSGKMGLEKMKKFEDLLRQRESDQAQLEMLREKLKVEERKSRSSNQVKRESALYGAIQSKNLAENRKQSKETSSN